MCCGAVPFPHLPCHCVDRGVQDVVRFTNNIQDNPWFGPAGPAMNGGPGERDLCANRLNRYQQRNMTEAKLVKTRGYGRATVIHHHGQASTSSMDGWAEQFFCRGETKVRQRCSLTVWKLPCSHATGSATP